MPLPPSSGGSSSSSPSQQQLFFDLLFDLFLFELFTGGSF
jgi:hypothetical protein